MATTALVIEDDADTADVLARALGDAGFTVERAAAGHDGRARLLHGAVDAVLLDYQLQDEDGITCLQAIRRRHPALPVVVMTAHGSEEIAVEAMKSGASDYVVKHGRWLDAVCRRLRTLIAAQGAEWTEPSAVPRGLLPPGSAEAALAVELGEQRGVVAMDGELSRAVEAALGASGDHRHDAAAREYEAALGAWAADGVQPHLGATLETARAEALWRAGRRLEARAVAGMAIERARPLGDGEVLARAALAYAGRVQGFGAATHDDTVVAVLKDALDRLPAGDGPLRALVMARLAEELGTTVAADDRLTLGRAAVRMARRLADPALIVAVLHTTHWALWQPEEVDDRRQLAKEAVELAERVGDRSMELEGQLLLVWCLLDEGDFAAAEEELEAASLLSATVREPYYAWLIAIARASLAFAAGRLREVETLAAEALSLGHQAQNPNAALFFAVQVASLYWVSGRDVEVESSLATIAAHVPLLTPVIQCGLAVTFAEAGRLGDTRRLFDAAMRDGTWRRIRGIAWLPAVSFLADACALLRDAPRAAELYEVLAPFDGRTVTLPPMSVYGPVAYYLGQLASARGEWTLAGWHFDFAMDLAGRVHARQWLARTQVAYASMLLDRGLSDDVLLARSLLAAAERTAEDLDLGGLRVRARALHASASGTCSGARPPTDAAIEAGGAACGIFRCDGDFWTLELDGQRVLIRDAKGLHYLRDLLEHAGEEIAAAELVAGASGRAEGQVPAQRGIPRGADVHALGEYRRRLRELPGEIADAERRGDLGDVERLRLESEAVQAEVEASVGLGGRARTAGDTLDRARTAVKKAIDYVLVRFRDQLPVLAHHLETHVKTGALCVYRVDPARPVVWRTRA